MTRRRLSALAAVPVIVAAALLWHRLPDNTGVYAPFDVHGGIGTTVSGRALAVRVGGVRIAQQLSGQSRWSTTDPVAATGRWVVVEATVSAAMTALQPSVELGVGPNTYRPSYRFTGYTLGNPVDPGIAQHGHWVFDVAPELVDAKITTPFELRVWAGLDDRLDNRIVVDLGSSSPARTAAVTIPTPRATG